jgi:hypothetical protein
VELHVGLTDEERARCRAVLADPLGADDAFLRFQQYLSPEQQEEYWEDRQTEIDGTACVLAAWPVDHAHVSARFLAFDWAPKRGGGAFWFLSGYLGRTQSGDEALTHLAFECEHDEELAVTTDVLRSFKPAEIVAKSNAVLAATAKREELLATWDLPDIDTLRELEQTAREARAMTLVRGRGGFPDNYYCGLAFDYLEEKRKGRGALGRLASLYGREYKTIRDHLSRAKAREFLQGGEPGTLSYEAGPRLYASSEPGERPT